MNRTTAQTRASDVPREATRDVEQLSSERSATTPANEEMKCTLCGLRACWIAPDGG